ncbi:MAG: lipo-like protein [Hyphomicrobiales bacterium]|nr:lipo-like protein [Hyphomicrobiales bacterium]MCP4999283.1 lipo-like protein [Hyphomicrobiales bacterium]
MEKDNKLVVAKDTWLDTFGQFVAGRLRSETSGYKPYTPSDPETLERTLRTGDILLVEGNQKISAAIKYLTQSTWSHAAVYVGDACGEPKEGEDRRQLIEVVIGEGCIASPLKRYATYNTRICRPVGLTGDDRRAVIDFMISRIGTKYDVKNIFDMLRYFLPTPPVPVRWRRRMLSFGSGDPTRAICSTLIAQAYQSVRYPILPEIKRLPGHMTAQSKFSRHEILHIRHHSLFTPRDFDLSPYFRVVKPTLEHGFDYKKLNWHSHEDHETTTADREFVVAEDATPEEEKPPESGV